MCCSEQVGVKAPGTATTTTFLFLNSVVVVVGQQDHKTTHTVVAWKWIHTFAGLVCDGHAADLVEVALVCDVGDVVEGDVLRERLAGERCHFVCVCVCV